MIEAVINNKKVILEAVVYYSTDDERVPCSYKCDLYKIINPNTPFDCEKFVPSCIAHKREDNKSVIYKIVEL